MGILFYLRYCLEVGCMVCVEDALLHTCLVGDRKIILPVGGDEVDGGRLVSLLESPGLDDARLAELEWSGIDRTLGRRNVSVQGIMYLGAFVTAAHRDLGLTAEKDQGAGDGRLGNHRSGGH